MGSSCNKRVFKECVARRIHEILEEQGEDQLEPKYLAHLQDELWKEYQGEVDEALTDGYKRDRIDGVVKRHRADLIELLGREKATFYEVVEVCIKKLIEGMKVESDSVLISRLADEMWEMVGYRIERGMKPRTIRHKAYRSCEKLLNADLVYQHRDALTEERKAGGDNVIELPEPEVIDDAVVDMIEGAMADFPEVDCDVIIIRSVAPCRCGAGVLADFERAEGGEEVALARKSRPQSLSYTRLSEGDYLGINAQIVS